MPKAAIATFVLLCPIAGSAVSDTRILPEIVVVGSRIEQPLEQVGSSVVVLYPDELMERGLVHLSDALREVPSLNASSYGPRGSQVQLRVRGSEANHLLVLMDGVRTSRADNGEFDFASMGLASIERIEILLGPQSTLYGSDAASGVISITTRKGKEGRHGRLRAAAGSYTSLGGSAQVHGANDGFHYAATVEYNSTDGISAARDRNDGNPLEDDASYAKSIDAKVGYDHHAFQTWMVYNRSHSRYDFDDDSYTTGRSTDNPHNRQWTDMQIASWVFTLPLMRQRWNNQLQLASVDNDYETYANDLANAPFVGESEYLANTDRRTVEYQGSFRLTERNILQFGAEYIYEELGTNYYSSNYGRSTFEDDIRQHGWYGQWLSTIDPIDLSLSGRANYHQEFGSYDTYRATASYRLGDQWRLSASYGTGFKPPSLLDLYNPALGGNADLEAEETESGEFGLVYTGNDIVAKATLFEQRTSNLIRWIPDPLMPWSGALENVDKAESQGVEVALEANRGDLEIEGALTWLDATETKDGTGGERLRVPEWSANLVTSYHLAKGRIFAEALYRGDRRDRNFATGMDVRLEAYLLFNLGINYELGDGLTLAARLNNLTDEEYEEVYSYGTPGRNGDIVFDWQF